MTSQANPRRAAVLTLGCRLNQAESGLLSDGLQRHGYRLVPWGADAELLVVNSCTVTAGAAAKTRKAVHAARRHLPDAYIVLVGCDGELSAEDWAADGAVDLILGNADKTRLAEVLPAELRRVGRAQVVARAPAGRGDPREAFTEAGTGVYPTRTRPHLKIQEGCDFRCSYCIVPRVRGPARSRRWDDALREGAELCRRGHREIVLTGVNIATYADGGRDLADLVEALLERCPGCRLRLSSTEPGPVLRRLVPIMAREPRLCRFLHLPLQYGEDTLLAAMNRRYRVAEFAGLAELAAAAVPGLCLGSDIIVGFPGETDATFAACCETVRRLPVNHLHVFTYSAREGTPAAAFPGRVPGDLASARAAALTRIGQEKAAAFARAQVGQRVQVLTEERTPGGAVEGWSDNYLRVTIEDAAGIEPNALVAVRLTADRGGRRLQGRLETET